MTKYSQSIPAANARSFDGHLQGACTALNYDTEASTLVVPQEKLVVDAFDCHSTTSVRNFTLLNISSAEADPADISSYGQDEVICEWVSLPVNILQVYLSSEQCPRLS